MGKNSNISQKTASPNQAELAKLLPHRFISTENKDRREIDTILWTRSGQRGWREGLMIKRTITFAEDPSSNHSTHTVARNHS